VFTGIPALNTAALAGLFAVPGDGVQRDITVKVDGEPVGTGTPPTAGDYTLKAAPSLTAAQIDAILADAGSPAEGTGRIWYAEGVRRGIDPAFALAFFIHESSAATNPAWAGWKPDGTHTHNVGNIICAGYPTCYGRFRDYPTWQAGIADWYRLIDDEYIAGRGTATVAEIIPIYAPAFENDVDRYVKTVEQLIDEWRGSGERPAGSPLGVAPVVLTQGYAVGTHAPAATWGAIDLAVAGGPGATHGQPVYATHAGTVIVTPNSYPAGNHVWVVGETYRTGYAHLASFVVQDGQAVQAGDQIGTVGSTGKSSGPHLDYQVWQRQGEQWVNVNPLDYGALEV
jgi:hypothetical protein